MEQVFLRLVARALKSAVKLTREGHCISEVPRADWHALGTLLIAKVTEVTAALKPRLKPQLIARNKSA